ncbi:hypothetical protein SPRG_16748 [Saprolegnia parasitica CBS 223.65]|uniref:Stress-response A/B barrel domain-containing protein n=2 Tax=Saprolegnia TaxID=4769 RepID=A0A067BL98_SAPPC|nr:hypothetical protein SPRG_16748 [Saprolegnia parasitica CBS 223.65]KDO17510.1 hypothetical protein SPRG_16748 [Saprolegnia parasitica CBS 223.65]|eukprot:XP_012211784.1 hypothetical protein SPRG_16748 [Saprolegnia parasitica CBS 223.65]
MEHIVLLQFKPEVTPEAITALGNSILALKEVVPGIIDMAFGEDLKVGYAQGFTHGLVARMESPEVLAAYDVHPNHVAVVKVLRELAANFLTFDFVSSRDAPVRSRV